MRYPYDDIFDHANSCEKVPETSKMTKAALLNKISNLKGVSEPLMRSDTL